MTMYHRGKKRSVYRKRDNAKAIGRDGVGQMSTSAIIQAPVSGTILIKSVRGRVLIPALDTGEVASGWIGFARYANVGNLTTYDLADSEVFGVQPWVVGNKTDAEIELSLKGITLTKGEAWYLVGHVNFASRGTTTIACLWQALFAEHEVPA